MGIRFRVDSINDKQMLESLPDPNDLITELDEVTEKHTRKMANQASENAPVKTGRLASSIPKSVEKDEDMAWIFGSDVEYATRQEYEHRSKKAFLRNAVYDGLTPYGKDLRDTIDKFTEKG